MDVPQLYRGPRFRIGKFNPNTSRNPVRGRWRCLFFGSVGPKLALAIAFLLQLPLTALFAAGAQSNWVSISWDSNPSPTLASYRLYYGVESGIYLTNVQVLKPTNSVTVTSLQPGRTYYFSVAALTTNGAEGEYSDEVTYQAPGRFLPPELTEDIVQVGGGGGMAPPAPYEPPVPKPGPSGPRLEILPVGQPPVAYFLSFEAPANKQCELQVSGDLLDWQRLVPFTTGSASQRLVLTDLAGTAPRRYYRLVIR